MIATMLAMIHICVSVRADQVTVPRRFLGGQPTRATATPFTFSASSIISPSLVYIFLLPVLPPSLPSHMYLPSLPPSLSSSLPHSLPPSLHLQTSTTTTSGSGPSSPTTVTFYCSSRQWVASSLSSCCRYQCMWSCWALPRCCWRPVSECRSSGGTTATSPLKA